MLTSKLKPPGTYISLQTHFQVSSRSFTRLQEENKVPTGDMLIQKQEALYTSTLDLQ